MKKPCACGCGQITNSMYMRGHHWVARAVTPKLPPPNPSGICHCGCGQKAPLAIYTSYKEGIIKGLPRKYCLGHGNRKHKVFEGPNPSGLCMCGCGGETSKAKYTDPTKGFIRGHHVRFIHNHHPEPMDPDTGYKVEDRGFETPCWVWQRWRDKDNGGYGYFTRKRKPVSAHRHFYEKYVGPITPGLEVHHRCHVTACVNPAHLQAVTNLANQRAKKLTQLTMEKARVIRQLSEWGAGTKAIAEVFKVGKHTIHAVVQNKTWKEGAI